MEHLIMTEKEDFEKSMIYKKLIKPIWPVSDEDIEKAPKELKSLKDLLNYYKSLK
tara:strand:+ start:903 stop:1067 length:165 start_codon:yes stop_codon:yes gene_type:complete